MEDPLAMDQDAPKTMAEALDWDDPADALRKLSFCSAQKATLLSQQLSQELAEISLQVPSLLTQPESLLACSDSISHSLTKIACGGSEASQEIKTLEEEKRQLEKHAQDVETALALRQCSQQAADALRRGDLKEASLAIQEYNEQARKQRHTPRALAYAGESTVQQIQASGETLQTTLLTRYQAASEQENLQALGELTPLLQMVQLEKEGVRLYMQYLKSTIQKEWPEAANRPLPDAPNSREIPPYIQMARIYNCAVSTIRHHLPMVSHCLYRHDGDAALVQLVHSSVETHVIPLLQQYVRDHQLHTIANHAQRIYTELEERYIGGMLQILSEEDSQEDDCGFSTQVGTLPQVDAALEEAALCLQHAESYTRFVQHSVAEVKKARKLRFQKRQESLKLERERQEWATGMASSGGTTSKDDEEELVEAEILPAHTQLHEVVAEVGGYYSGIERCLLLASMQRSFFASTLDPYSPLGIKGHNTSTGSRALKTSLVETCFYAARHGMQRAFATGHTGTAAACANFGSDVLGGVLLQVMTGRAQESGVALLKPGEGLLLAGSSSSLASNLIRQGHAAVGAGAVVIGQQVVDESERQLKMQQGIARACATLNDLEVAVHHTKHLERLLMDSIDKGYPPHDAEQLRMCVKSLVPVAESFLTASDGAVESLLSVLTTRVRSIVSDAVGSEGSAASASFMGSSVMGGHAVDRVTVRMNYNLDDEAYQLLQLSEGYMTRMCSSLEELIQPLRIHLAPRLADATVLGLISLAAKRIESAIRRVCIV